MIAPKKVLKIVREQARTLQAHYKTLDILEGNLEPYVEKSLARVLSPRVLVYALERLVPINIMPRYVDKLTSIYQTGVIREVMNGQDADKELLGWYEKKLNINSVMHYSNRLYNACRSTLIHPYATEKGPALRIIPNDRFCVWSDDETNPTKPTGVILMAGKDAQGREIFWVYTADEFYIIRGDETIDVQSMAEMGIEDGINPYGALPFVYVNSSQLRLVPVPDIDTLKMTEYVPTALTDLNLAAMFSAFSMTYIKDGNIENPTYAPNALWFLKADDPEKEVQIGTIKPEVDYQEVLNLIQSELSMWLGSKGIKSGSVGNLTVESAASGIAKMIDEADTFDVRQAQTLQFGQAEHELWDLILHKMHPIWITQNLVDNRQLFSASAEVATKFSVIPVGTQRVQLIQEQRDEYAAGFTTRKRAIAALNPQLTSQQVDELLEEITGIYDDDDSENETGNTMDNSDSPDNSPDMSSDNPQSTSIQDAVLNGAQVNSAVEILTAAAIGQIPRESAKALFEVAFQLDSQTADRLLSNIGNGFTPQAVKGSVTTKPEASSGNQVAENQG